MTVWPSKENPIAKIRFALMQGFDAGGNPVYGRGTVDSAEEREEVQRLLAPLVPSPLSVAAVTMGEVELELQDGSSVTLRPVFHPSRDRYGDLFTVPALQYPMPSAFAELLERWRRQR